MEKLSMAARSGDVWAMGHLGYSLLMDNVYWKEGERWLRRSAEAGGKEAMGWLGYCLITGYKLPMNIVEGEYWLRKAAELGDIWAMDQLGSLLVYGKWLRKKTFEGEYWLKKAARAGSVSTMIKLGKYLLQSAETGGRGKGEGEKWLREAAKQGNYEAMIYFGRYLLKNAQTSVEKQEGAMWLLRVVEFEVNQYEYDVNQLSSQFFVELMSGKDDPKKLSALCKQAKKFGDVWTLLELSKYIANGHVPSRIIHTIKKLLRLAALNGKKTAIRELGLRLIGNYGMERNVKEGMYWLKKAADQGDYLAMGILGVHFLKGEGLPRDKQEGVKWLSRAVRALA
jgi:TPR repeat protein